MELGVEAIVRHEFVMRAVFGDDSSVDDDDLVGVADGAEAVGDGDDGLALHQPFQRVDHEFFGFAVERGGGFVEQKDRAVANHHPGDADALALPAGERQSRGRRPWCRSRAACAMMKSCGIRELRGFDDLFSRRSGAAEGDVLADGAAEQHGVLQDVADLVAQMLQFVVANIWPSMLTVPACTIVEPRDQTDDGGFSAARRADDADKLAGLDIEAHVGEDGIGRIVAKGDVLEFDFAGEGLGLKAVGFFGDDGVGIENGADAFDADCGLCDSVGRSRKIFDRLEELAR